MKLSGGMTDRFERVRVLEEDADMASVLPRDELELAVRQVVAPLLVLEPGRYRPESFGSHESRAGTLVLDGLIIRQVEIAGRSCGELLGPGALLRPWDHSGEYAPVPFELHWHVLETTRLAILNDRFLRATGQWPGLARVLIERGVERAEALAYSVAIHSLQHVTLRLLFLLWHLADRFGSVTRDGTVVPLRLTHEHLAELIGAQRPTVSKAIGELSREGRLARRADRSWLLLGDPPEELRDQRRPRLGTSRHEQPTRRSG